MRIILLRKWDMFDGSKSPPEMVQVEAGEYEAERIVREGRTWIVLKGTKTGLVESYASTVRPALQIIE